MVENLSLNPVRPSPLERTVRKDLKRLATFISTYCKHQHGAADRSSPALKTHDVEAILGRPIALCPECTALLAHAFVKRSSCTLDPKPSCKHCATHCYHPRFRQGIQEVMRFSGRRLILSGRLDYLFHLLF